TDMFNIYTNRKERDKYLQLLTKKKRLVNYERELVRKDGKKIWAISNIMGVFDEKNELVKIRGYIFDITIHKQAEQALRQSEERFRDLFDNAPDMYIILDPNATVLDFNKRGLKQLGYATNQIIGKSITNFIHPEDLEQAREVMNIIHKTNKAPKNIEVRLLNSRGEFLWVSKEFSLLQTAEGKLQAIRVVCRDITESKRLKEELARSQRLETAGRVAGQIAHDFNNLLAPLTAYPALISEDLAADHPVMEMVEEMESAAHKIAEINQQLLALGRRGHYPMEPIDLNELIQKVFYSHTVPKQIVLQKDLAMDLFLIKGGAAQLTRALTNIIINAIEAMQGIGVLNIKTENVYLDEPLRGYQTIQRGEYVKLEISDSGTGIEPEIFNKIFEPFFTTKKMDRMRGSGLGLSVVHSIMEDHKGYLTVDTVLGQGTSFALYFPISRELTIKKGDSILKSKRGHERILVVDDDPVQRRVVKQLLTRLGYKVQTVASGEEAIAHLKKQAQDLLILDMVMEGMDGAETYRQILAFQPLQKAIILSGYAMSQRVDEALRLGADSFISKPVILNDLATAVRQALDNTTKLKHVF
ncbi:MAG: PAS domain S-box protein, partial [bacterium]